MTAVGCGTVEVNPPQNSIKQREKCGLGSTNDGFYLGPDPGTIDCEGDEHDGREPGEDDEPSLGWPERMVQGISHSDTSDGELSVGTSS